MATNLDKKQIEAAKQGVKQYLATVKVVPEILVMLVKWQKPRLKTRPCIPCSRTAINSKLVEPTDLDNEIDYTIFGVFRAMGKLTEQMLANGELGGV